MVTWGKKNQIFTFASTRNFPSSLTLVYPLKLYTYSYPGRKSIYLRLSAVIPITNELRRKRTDRYPSIFHRGRLFTLWALYYELLVIYLTAVEDTLNLFKNKTMAMFAVEMEQIGHCRVLIADNDRFKDSIDNRKKLNACC